MNFENDIKNCINVLKTGGIILYPTDTIWGLGCDATNKTAVAKIYSLKKRAENKSMIILLNNKKEIKNYCKAPSEAIKKILGNETRPLTVIYPDAKNLAINLIGVDGTVAIRIVKDSLCEAIINLFGKPIVSTSANFSGDESPKFFKEIFPEIINGVDYVVNYRRDDNVEKKPSKILLWKNDDEIVVIRE